MTTKSAVGVLGGQLLEKPLILHVSSLGGGGAEATLFRLVTSDHTFRHHVVSLTGLERYGQSMLDLGIPVTTLDLPRGRLRARALLRLWRLIRAERPFAVQTWMYHSDLIGGVVARAALQRNVLWNLRHSSLDPALNSRKTIAIARLCARLSHWVPRRIVCCSSGSRQAHADLGYDDSRMVVIPNGYDLSHLYPDPQAGLALRRELGLSGLEPVFGMVGRYVPEKDHDNLLAALAVLVARGLAFKLLLVGQGISSDNAELVALIARHGLQERVLLSGPRTDIRAVMSALDMHLLSSRTEGFPNVVAEAMACGAVSISTLAGDASDIIGECGWLVPTRNPEALADAVFSAIQMQSDSVQWSALISSARARVAEKFSIGQMVAHYGEAWREATT